ncbi:MAG: winged helix-turn-helix domain-containing protein [Saprospiraceae bacterium]|nr:winged helix-turn-helix domain-containing protein [Saprospiraceae bacterium]
MDQNFYLKDCLVEPSLLRITKAGQIQHVEPLLMAVLLHLANNPLQVIPKAELREAIWGEVIVTDNVLTKAISSLRRLLGDSITHPEYIETISKTGYRLIAEVKPAVLPSHGVGEAPLSRRIALTLGTALLLILGVLLLSSDFRSSEPLIYQPIPLANTNSTEYWPALSPDGKFVAYGWQGANADNWDIYVKQIGSSTVKRMTTDPATELRAKWSRDGSHLYYLRYTKSGATIFKRPLLGGAEVRILAAPTYSTGDFNVSPDEKWISFNDREKPNLPARIKLISVETGESKWVTQPDSTFKGDLHPTFSNDGTQLAFIREKNPTSMQLWRIKLKDGQLEQITKVHQSINGFAWSADNKHLLYSGDQTGLYKIWQISLAYKKSQLMPIGDYQMVMPRVSLDGNMVYAKMKDDVNIWTYDLETKEAKEWRGHHGLELNPSISPNGQQVSFTATVENKFQIWVANIDGSSAKPITQFHGEDLGGVRWTKDGAHLLFHGFQEGKIKLLKVDAQGGPIQQISPTSGDQLLPYPGPDGQLLFCSRKAHQWEIRKMQIDGSKSTGILSNNAYAPQMSMDQSILFYCKKDEMGLWSFDLNEQKERKVIANFHPMYWGAFVPAPGGIFYWDEQEKQIFFFDDQLQSSRPIYRPSGRIPRMGISLHFSPKQNLLIFSQIDHRDADIMTVQKR